MTDMNSPIREIKSTFVKFILFRDILDSVILLLAIYLVLTLFNYFPPFWYVPVIIFFIIITYKRIKKIRLKEVEDKHSFMGESLRTAADTAHHDSFIVKKLRTDVLNYLKKVRVSSFLSIKDATIKLFIISLLSFGIIMAAGFNVHLYDVSGLVMDIGPILPFDDMRSGSSSELYGDPSIAELSDEEFDFEIQTGSYEINLRDVQEVEEKTFSGSFPSNVGATATESFEEKIEKEKQDIVKKYFKLISEG